MKISRPLSILLCFIVLISSFTVSVYGADNVNIVSTDFREWTVFEGNVTINSYGGYNTIACRPSIAGTATVPYCTIYDLTDGVVVGNKYKISFNFHNSDEYLGGGAGLIGSEAFLSYGGLMFVGLGSLTTLSNGEQFYNPVEGCYVQINKDNYSQMTDTLTEFSFELPNGVINPCIMIYFICAVDSEEDIHKSVYLVFTDFSAIDLTKSEEDGFFARLFEWFEVKFKAIGDSFSDLGDKLVDLKDDFTDSISNLGNSIKGFFDTLSSNFDTAISGLGNSIDGFFTKLGNLILYASWSVEPPENPFVTEDKPMSSLSTRLKAISDSFASSGESFKNVIDSITGPVYLLDEFTNEFGWLLGILIFTLAVIVISRFIGL